MPGRMEVLATRLDGWRNQQFSRNLQFATIDQRERLVRRFAKHVNLDPWEWTPALVEEFSADLRTIKRISHSTLRGYHAAVRAFATYISNPDYGLDRLASATLAPTRRRCSSTRPGVKV